MASRQRSSRAHKSFTRQSISLYTYYYYYYYITKQRAVMRNVHTCSETETREIIKMYVYIALTKKKKGQTIKSLTTRNPPGRVYIFRRICVKACPKYTTSRTRHVRYIIVSNICYFIPFFFFFCISQHFQISYESVYRSVIFLIRLFCFIFVENKNGNCCKCIFVEFLDGKYVLKLF